LLLQSGTPGFEYFRSDLGKNVRFIGPLLPYGENKHQHYQLPLHCKQFNKKILVTQGTVETDAQKIIVPTLEAFKNTDILVVVTTGGSQTQELRNRYPYANILIEDFIPFSDIMQECDVYVTNGGYGGVMLAIQNELPIVAAGVHEGKNEINARIGYFKLGINLKTERPAPSQIKAAVEAILRDQTYKNSVDRLAKEFEEYDPALLCEKYVNELLPKQEKNTRATFLRMIQKYAEEKVY
jgi:UDP:flavonoid glycosyltransferase YjiC (YdhE family)